MALTKYELVNTKGLKGIDYKGRFIPFDKITDELAAELEGKTHVLKRKESVTTEPTVALSLPAAEAEPTAEAASTTTRKPRSN